MPSPRRPNTLLRALLAEARWTQGSLARAVNIVAAEVGLELDYDRTAVAHWLSGTQPQPPVPQLVAEALTRRLERLVTASEAGLAAEGEPPAPGAGPGAALRPEASLAELCRTESDPVRRLPAQAQPYRVTELTRVCGDPPEGGIPAPGPPAPPAPPDPPGGREPPGPHDGDTATELALMRSAVRFYAAAFNAHGGRNARSALAAYLADDVLPRLRAPQPAPVHRTLLVEASRLSFLLARMYEDSSVQGLAQRHFLAALSLAEESGDRVAGAVVLRGLSAQGLALGHRQASLQAAEAAAAAARGAGGPTGTFLLAQLAVAQAACGLRAAALDSLGRAELAMAAGGPEGRTAGPFDAYSRAAFEYQRAETLRKVGDIAGARAAMNRSLAHRSPEDHRGLALSYAQRAEMLAGAGHVEEACASWHSFLDQYSHVRSGAAKAAVTRSRKILIPFRHLPAAAVLLARLAAVAPAGKRR
ncbi:hypothetical protein [Streptomyces sp. NPDC053427]|uniref:hypothetical protein n=1 Tax=Streptomyces sp. NPDC053427 TaxID=3365701 RepID=UPI0037CEF7E2